MPEPQPASFSRPATWLSSVAVGAILALAVIGIAGAQGASWLDNAPRQWNTPGATVPTAPTLALGPRSTCHTRERKATSREEAQVSKGGWFLESYWPTVHQGDVAVVLGTSNYDGMCRPIGFNAFVFVGNRYAGTLSPVNLGSRTDGVPQDVPRFLANGEIQATFLRYAANDPLCCPSLPPTTVRYRIDQRTAGPVVVAIQIGRKTAAPVKLPQVGEWFWIEPMTLLVGLGVLGFGLKVRQVR